MRAFAPIVGMICLLTVHQEDQLKAIPKAATQCWTERIQSLSTSAHGWRVRIETDKGISELIIKQTGEKRLVDVVRAEYKPGSVSSGLAVYSPDASFTLKKNENGEWLYLGYENAKEQTIPVATYRDLAYSVNGLPVSDFLRKCTDVSCAENGGLLLVSYAMNDGGGAVGRPEIEAAGTCTFDSVNSWRLVSREETRVTNLGQRGIKEFRKEKDESKINSTWDYSGPGEIKVRTEVSSTVFGDSTKTITATQLSPPADAEFTLGYYGLNGIVQPTKRSFWTRSSFWLVVVGILFIAASVWMRRRARLVR